MEKDQIQLIAILAFLALVLTLITFRYQIVAGEKCAYKMDRISGRTWFIYGDKQELVEGSAANPLNKFLSLVSIWTKSENTRKFDGGMFDDLLPTKKDVIKEKMKRSLDAMFDVSK